MVGKKLLAVGIAISAVSITRINVSLRRAYDKNPGEVASALARIGYSSPPSEAEILILGYQYAFLRKFFPELDGTLIQSRQNALCVWFALLFIGALLLLAGLVIEVKEGNAARL